VTQPTERVEAAGQVLNAYGIHPKSAPTQVVAKAMLDAADEADGITFRVMRPEYVEVEGWAWCNIHGPVGLSHHKSCPGPHRKLFTEAHQHHFVTVTKCESCGEVGRA
jgi:hypothetical protein